MRTITTTIFLWVWLAVLLWGASSSCWAWGVFLRLGPASLGNGGANPLGIPPQSSDMELSVITDSSYEFNVGLPGILIGKRYQRSWGGYLSWGGALAASTHGGGLGGYTAFGMDGGGDTVRVNIEYKQVLAVGEHVIAPYAFRVGVGLWF